MLKSQIIISIICCIIKKKNSIFAHNYRHDETKTANMKGNKPLMSEMLDDTRRYLEQAEKTDVDELRNFLMTEPERPMIVTGQGGSHICHRGIYLCCALRL